MRHLNNPWIRYQILFALGLAACVWLLVDTAIGNIQQRNIATGFSFLLRPANFNFGEALIPVNPSDSYGWALLTAFINTLWVSVWVCLLATVLGVLIAFAGKSKSVVIRRVLTTYIEVFRNTPLLLQLLLWYTLIQALPPVRQAIGIGGVLISQRGIALPSFSLDATRTIFVLATLCVWIVALKLMNYVDWQSYGRRAVHFVGILLVGITLLTGLSFETPEIAGFNFRGGWRLSPEFLALTIGITLYAAAFIAEIVRSGIDAVPNGQWEAASSLGLGHYRCFRLIVLPQAARVSIPPLVSEYGGIVKNSSLAVAIGYPDLVWATNTAISQTGQAIEGIALLMIAYLLVSIAISVVLNIFNQRMVVRHGK